MNKRYIVQIWAVAIVWAIGMCPIFAQNTNRRGVAESHRRAEQARSNEQKNVGLSVRAQNKFGVKNKEEAAEPWLREIYRELSEDKEENMPLFFPKNPTEKSMNLFTLIFKLLADGKIYAYEYDVDRGEFFDEEHRLSFVDLLERYQILYEEEIERTTRKITYKVENSDIPAQLVKSYYLKEIYTFERVSSTYRSDPLCLAPIMYQEDGYGAGTQRIPMFWIKYDELAPYLGQMYIMASNLNNTMRLTYNDYFRLKKYKGDIYKSTNLANKSLMQIAKNDTAQLRIEREKIEKQLNGFEGELWVKQDTTQVQTNKKEPRKARTARAEVTSGKTKAKKPVKKESGSGGGSSGGRTVRASVRR